MWKQAFQEANKYNSKSWIKVNHPKNYLYQDYKLHCIPIISKKGNIKRQLNNIFINKVGNFINISDEDLVIEGNSLDCIMLWVIRRWKHKAVESR